MTLLGVVVVTEEEALVERGGTKGFAIELVDVFATLVFPLDVTLAGDFDVLNDCKYESPGCDCVRTVFPRPFENVTLLPTSSSESVLFALSSSSE